MTTDEQQDHDSAAISDVQLAVSDIGTMVMDFEIDNGDELPIIVQSAIKVLNKAVRDLHSILEGASRMTNTTTPLARLPSKRIYCRCASCWGIGKKHRMFWGRIEWLNEDCLQCKGKGKWYENVIYWDR